MLSSLLFMTLLAQKPMKVTVGDPILDLKLTNLESGEVMPLESLIIDGFCFFMSPSCPRCEEAFENISVLTNDFYHIFIFSGDQEKVNEFMKDKNISPDRIFMATNADLEKYDITTVPAVVAYKNNKVRVAMHGKLNYKNIYRLKHIFTKQITN